jgi:hypothetical protein
MSLTFCNIHFTHQPEKTIYASGSLIRQLDLTGKRTLTLKLGQKTVLTSVKPIKKKGKHLYLSSSIRNLVHFPQRGRFMVSLRDKDELQVGPLIGILTQAKTRSAEQPFGTRSPLIKQYLRAGANSAFYFAFTPKDINWHNETVTGFFPGKQGGWSRKVVPLPDVVYNRLPSRIAETTSTMESFKERFSRRNIPLFNWGFFTKSEVYDLLENEPEASKHVPESHIHPTSDRIKDMLEKYQIVYIKPTGGSLGRGIYRLTYHPKRGYFARYRRNGSNVLLRFSKFTSLMKMLNRHKGRMNNHVIQQGIRLIELDNCPLDFRFHMNKNAQNQWVASGIGAKKAGRGSVTTHVRNGGQLMTPEQALERAFGSDADEVLQEAKRVSIRLAEAIERNYPHLIGELGFDLGIDKNRKIWMFEANSKPGRSIFKHPSLKEQGRASLKHIFEYCLYLSKFRVRRET